MGENTLFDGRPSGSFMMSLDEMNYLVMKLESNRHTVRRQERGLFVEVKERETGLVILSGQPWKGEWLVRLIPTKHTEFQGVP